MTWTSNLRLSELSRGAQTANLAPPEGVRTEWAATLGLLSLPELEARITARSWLDGAELTGWFRGTVEQTCGISLDAFSQAVEGAIELRVVPRGSPNAPVEASGGEVDLDPDAPDPPDVLEGEILDLGHVLFEHLALAIDPFPRKPDAVFDYAAPADELSPFSVLKQLKEKDQ